MKNSLILISVGVFNFLHGILHIIQFVQSMMLVAYSAEEHVHESWVDKVMHNPIFAILWAIIGIVTLVIGIKDYIHHRKCRHEHNHTN